MTVQAIDIPAYPLVIDGHDVAVAQHSDVLDPATGSVIAHVPNVTTVEVDAAVTSARRAFGNGYWSRLGLSERSALLHRLADFIEQSATRLGELEMANTGKTRKMVLESELPFIVDNIRFFAGAARHLSGLASGEYMQGMTSIIRREPIGVVASITPWNYPFMMAVWKAMPALAAGNCVVLKPALQTPLTALELAALGREAGLPDGVLTVITGGDDSGAALVRHPGVSMVSLTGDLATEVKVMQGGAEGLKRVHLELGGKAPFVVFADADLDAAVHGAVTGALVNCGQDCTAAAHIYVHQSIYERFLTSFVDKVAQVRVGLPSDATTDMGPLISLAQRDSVDGFVQRARRDGATILCGGHKLTAGLLANGAFYAPTVITNVAQSSEIVQSEVFGPVVVVLPFADEAEAINLANDGAYGLAASVWTHDLYTAMRVSAALNFGTVWINDHLPLTAELPHGGFKKSGFGKDMSHYALEDYTQIKHVMLDLTGEARKGWHYTVWGDPNRS